MRVKTLALVSVFAALAALLAFAPRAASGETVVLKGTIEGVRCAMAGKRCPTERLDPHIATEPDFVLRQFDGTYYFMPNIDRSIKARHVGQEVRVTGELKGKALMVERIELKVDAGYETIWMEKWENELIRELLPPG